jgi:hypothetical protein
MRPIVIDGVSQHEFDLNSTEHSTSGGMLGLATYSNLGHEKRARFRNVNLPAPAATGLGTNSEGDSHRTPSLQRAKLSIEQWSKSRRAAWEPVHAGKSNTGVGNTVRVTPVAWHIYIPGIQHNICPHGSDITYILYLIQE